MLIWGRKKNEAEVFGMVKISGKASVRLSLLLTVLFMAALIVAAIAMPWLAYSMMHMPRDTAGQVFVLVIVYAILLAIGGVLYRLLSSFCQRDIHGIAGHMTVGGTQQGQRYRIAHPMLGKGGTQFRVACNRFAIHGGDQITGGDIGVF